MSEHTQHAVRTSQGLLDRQLEVTLRHFREELTGTGTGMTELASLLWDHACDLHLRRRSGAGDPIRFPVRPGPAAGQPLGEAIAPGDGLPQRPDPVLR